MNKKKHILITNQHGENRGDESALRAMLNALNINLEDVKFTVIAQLQDTSLKIDFKEEVELLHMKMSIPRFLGLVIYAIFKKFGIILPILLNQNSKGIIDAYRDCDVVVSAPGGPYFGDIYSNHEILHWFYIWLGVIFNKKLFLYAPSAGPFKIKWLNYIRKHFYKEFDVLSLREDISKGYLEGLIGNSQEIHVTADSAIQQIVPPMNKSEYFSGSKQVNKEKFLIAVSAIEYKFPDEVDPESKKKEYTEVLLNSLRHLVSRENYHLLFIPQLYGKVHSDLPYLEYLTSCLPADASWEIVDQSLNSNEQRAIFGMCDLCIASRYHPQIFSGSSAVPGVCIYYEHKALGFMKFMGLEEFAFDIRNLNTSQMIEKIDYAIENSSELKNKMKNRIGAIINKSATTTDLLLELMNKNK